MEIIRKKISLEKSRSRKQGLLPYFPFNSAVTDYFYVTSASTDGNYGGFVMNFKTSAETSYHCYMDIMRKYNKIIDILCNGTKVKRVIKDDEVMWVLYPEDNLDLYKIKTVNKSEMSKEGQYLYKYTGFDESILTDYFYLNIVEDDSVLDEITDTPEEYCTYVESLIGRLVIPKDIDGPYVPNYLNLCDISVWIEWMKSHKGTKDCCDLKLYKEKGGDKMLEFLLKHETDFQEALDNIYSTYEFKTPTIEIPLLITQDLETIGVLETYMTEDGNYEYSGHGETTYLTDISGYTVESRLEELKLGNQLYDDSDNEIKGILIKASANTFYEYSNVEKDWVLSEDSYSAGYETVMYKNAISDDADLNSIYKASYINDSENPTKIPYEVNRPKNIGILQVSGTSAVCSGDFIMEIEESGSDRTFTYVFGGLFYSEVIRPSSASSMISQYTFKNYISGTGIIYQETREIVSGVDYVSFDFVENVPLYYTALRSKNTKEVSPMEYDLTRTASIANIIAMPVMKTYTTKEMMSVPVFKPDYLMGVTKDLRTTSNITINRGNGTAFEKRFQLLECNTLEDLENYKNNTFGL